MYCFANFVSLVQIPHSIEVHIVVVLRKNFYRMNYTVRFESYHLLGKPLGLAHPLLRGKLVSIICLLLPQINGLEFKPLNLCLPNLQEKYILKIHLYFGKKQLKNHILIFNKFKDFDNMYVLITIHEGLRSKSGFNLKQGFRGLGFEL